MIDLIRKKMKNGKTEIEVQHFVTMCALDIIIETAMGGKSDLQSLDYQSDYVQAINDGNYNVCYQKSIFQSCQSLQNGKSQFGYGLISFSI